MTKKMRSKMEDLLEREQEAGLEALFAFYASQQ
jgi:sulfide dehydrogenase cytochrome subunit